VPSIWKGVGSSNGSARKNHVFCCSPRTLSAYSCKTFFVISTTRWSRPNYPITGCYSPSPMGSLEVDKKPRP
jgi:hypothetical protein